MNRYLLLTLITFFGLVSCQKEFAEPDFNDNIKIKMYEDADISKRTLFFNCYTEKIYSCANYKINATYVKTDNKITINFISVPEVNVCYPGTKPASTLIKLEGIENKTYELEIYYGEVKFVGQLVVTATDYKATITPQPKVVFINSNMIRIPANTIYGTLQYNFDYGYTASQKFLDSLTMEQGAEKIQFTPGDYGHFQIDANGDIVQHPDQDPEFTTTRSYIYKYEGLSERLKQLVKRFGKKYPESLLVILQTSKGETYNGWLP